jgi:hypothetical protein
MFEGLFENLRFQRLLAQEPMKFANLVLQSPIIRSRHDLFPTAGRRVGRPPLPDDELVSKIKAVIAELPTYGYRRVHARSKTAIASPSFSPPVDRTHASIGERSKYVRGPWRARTRGRYPLDLGLARQAVKGRPRLQLRWPSRRRGWRSSV